MTENEQRIAIAEACGWRREEVGAVGYNRYTRWIIRLEPNDYDRIGNPPDYLSDLNAMHEAEKVLTLEQTWNYADLLRRSVSKETNTPLAHVETYHATAAQRAEAFLRTLNLWKD